MNEWLSNASAILSFIVLLGATVTAICTIINKVFKPFHKRHEKKRQEAKDREIAEEKERIAEQLNLVLPGILKKHDEENRESYDDYKTRYINEELPQILHAHDLEIRDRDRADREQYLQDIKAEVLTSMQSKLDIVDLLQVDMGIMIKSGKDVLREKIMMLYHKNKKNKTLQQHEREALNEWYKDYKAMNGNSYIDKYYCRMEPWKVIDDDYED